MGTELSCRQIAELGVGTIELFCLLFFFPPPRGFFFLNNLLKMFLHLKSYRG